MGVKFKNNAESTLAAGINASVTTCTLATGEGNNFPIVTSGATDFFYATLIDSSGTREIIKVTEHQSGDTFQVIERGADDSSASSFITSDKVQLRLTKATLEAMLDDIDTAEAAIVVNAAGVAANVVSAAANTAALALLTGILEAPAGLKMFFYEDTAPAGWTIDTGPADSLLAVKGGSNAYNSTGGQVLGSWTPTGHTHTGPSHTHTMGTHTHTGPSHTHSGAAHTHTIYRYGWGASNAGGIQVGYIGPDNTGNHQYATNNTTSSAASAANTGAGGTGATGATDPGDTNAGGTAATGSSKEPSTDRPAAAVGIIATKD